jgi:hypothetical protein
MQKTRSERGAFFYGLMLSWARRSGFVIGAGISPRVGFGQKTLTGLTICMTLKAKAF